MVGLLPIREAEIAELTLSAKLGHREDVPSVYQTGC